MSDSLKDQLLALGLAKAKRDPAGRSGKGAGRRKDRSEPNGERSGEARGQRAGQRAELQRKRRRRDLREGEPSLRQAWALREKDERREAERARARKLAEERRRREINQGLQALVDEHALNESGADLKRYFEYKGRIRSVLVTRDQLGALNEGELALVFLKGGYYLVPPAVAREAAELSPEHVPDLGGSGAETSEDESHPVPDDLIW